MDLERSTPAENGGVGHGVGDVAAVLAPVGQPGVGDGEGTGGHDGHARVGLEGRAVAQPAHARGGGRRGAGRRALEGRRLPEEDRLVGRLRVQARQG